MENLFGEQKILGLNWKQPYAELMLHGKIETRTWLTHYRGLVLIIASKEPYSLVKFKEVAGDQTLNIESKIGASLSEILINQNNVAIAIGNLIDCRQMLKEDERRCFVQYKEPWQEWSEKRQKFIEKRLWCHVYENVRRVKPFEIKGAQKWKKLTPEIINQIEFI